MHSKEQPGQNNEGILIQQNGHKNQSGVFLK